MYRRYSKQRIKWDENSRKIMRFSSIFLEVVSCRRNAYSTFFLSVTGLPYYSYSKILFFHRAVFFCKECESKLLGVWSLLEQTRQDYIKWVHRYGIQCSGSASEFGSAESVCFGPTGSASGSVIYLYRSGSGSRSFHQQAKKWRKSLTFTFMCLYDFLYWKNDVNLPSKRNKQKKIREKTKIIFCRRLGGLWRKEQDPHVDPLVTTSTYPRIRIESGSVPKNVTDLNTDGIYFTFIF